MCGRYATTRGIVDLIALFDAADDTEADTDGLRPDYNVAPTDPVPVVRLRSGERLLSVARWGLVPHWAKDTKGAARMINARAETVTNSNAFAAAFARRRCLVPADGWFEWVKVSGGGKQAYFMTPTNGQIVVFAGLWATWGPDNLLTCSIITAPAVDDLALVHDRMPLLLPADRWASWLGDPASGELLAPPPSDFVAGIELRPVGAAVGDVRNDGPELVSKVPALPLIGRTDEPIDLTLF
jgi:putative SOS response-associated peptidase YedK